jgi:hypothetical protein
MVDSASISQALYALGHSVNCVANMRGRSRLTITHQIYGRPSRPGKAAREQMHKMSDEHLAKIRTQVEAGLFQWSSPEVNASFKEHQARVKSLYPSGRAGGSPFHKKPPDVRVAALEEAAKLTTRCSCGCPRNHRKSKMFNPKLVQAIGIYSRGDWGNLNLFEFLTKTFGEDFEKVLRLR